MYATKAEAVNAPKGNIRLAYCPECGYIGNQAFDFTQIRYDSTYSFSLHHSPVYQRFIHDLANRLIGTYGITNKSILEIACGQGDFLRLLCQLGDNAGCGIDPSLPESISEYRGSTPIRFIRDYFGEKYAAEVGNLVVCRHLLDQLDQPRSFLELVRRTIGQRREPVIYFELPNATAIFQELSIWSITYEKSSWFTPYSLKRLFEISGFQVLSVAPCYVGGQYLAVEAVPDSHHARSAAAEAEKTDQFSHSLHVFTENYRQKVQVWEQQLAALQRSNQRVIAWGAGAGAISFLNTFKITELIPYVVDINQRRQGKFLPLTGQQVVAPEFIQQYQPDTIIVTNPT
ncbi:MAG TPA: class I SAM-dependent methyltransferase, partial [Caldilineaceae bacterium]|nr:class I SAM-dependent methyltransferase [Caldilineaceae bacterium]